MNDADILQALGITGGPSAASQFSDQDVLNSLGLGGAPAQGPVTSPGDQPAGTQPVTGVPPSEVLNQTVAGAGAGAPTSAAVSGSASYSGFSPAKNAQVTKTATGIDADINRAQAGSEARAAESKQALEDSAKEQRLAIGAETKAKIDEIMARGEGNARLAGLQNQFTEEESRIVSQEQGEAAKRKADYVQAINDFRASRVDPNALWDGLGRGGQFAAGVLAFAHGFLAMSGKKEEGLDLFLKGIDRNIEAQVQNIKIKGESVGMFKNLWDEQRAQSASDAEARLRVRGLALESAKTSTEAELSKYESGLAQAQGQSAIAAIDKESAKNLVDLNKHIDATAEAFTKDRITRWAEAAKLSMEQAKLAAKTAAGANLVKVVDPDTNKPFRVFKPEFQDPKENSHLHQQVLNDTGHLESTMRDLREIRDMARQLDESSPGGVLSGENRVLLAGELQRRYNNLANNIATSEARGEIGRINFQEILMKRQGTPIETWMTRGGVDKILADTTQDIIGRVHGELQQFTDVLPADQGGHERPYEPDYTEAGYTIHPKATDPEKAQRQELEKGLEGPQSEENARTPDLGKDVITDHRRFRKEHPELASSMASDEPGQASEFHPEDIAAWEKSMTRLKELAQGGDSGAVDSLVKEATPYITGSDTQDPRAVYAVMMLHDLGYNPRYGNAPETPVQETAHETAP